jgi:hypothetical protein
LFCSLAAKFSCSIVYPVSNSWLSVFVFPVHIIAELLRILFGCHRIAFEQC